MVISSLGLDGFDDDGGNWVVVAGDQLLDFRQGSGFNGLVLFNILLERILQDGERCLWPVKGRNIQLVDGLAASGGERAEETTVERGLEGQDGKWWRSRRGVVHAGFQFSFGEFHIVSSTLLLTFPHESCLVGSLVGVGSGHGGEDLVQSLRSYLEDTGLENRGPVMRRKVSQRWSVDEGIDHLLGAGSSLERWVAIAYWDGSDLGIAVGDRWSIRVKTIGTN